MAEAEAAPAPLGEPGEYGVSASSSGEIGEHAPGPGDSDGGDSEGWRNEGSDSEEDSEGDDSEEEGYSLMHEADWLRLGFSIKDGPTKVKVLSLSCVSRRMKNGDLALDEADALWSKAHL